MQIYGAVTGQERHDETMEIARLQLEAQERSARATEQGAAAGAFARGLIEAMKGPYRVEVFGQRDRRLRLFPELAPIDHRMPLLEIVDATGVPLTVARTRRTHRGTADRARRPAE